MQVDGVHYRSIWVNADGWSVDVIDQTRLPFSFAIKNLTGLEDACFAIRDMVVRGAPLIGATAAYGFYLALRQDPSADGMQTAYEDLLATRPTAVNLRWALDLMRAELADIEPEQRAERAFEIANRICESDVATNQAIGRSGLSLIETIAAQKAGEPVNILTHCNAGWLATVDWGTATAPIYLAQEKGIPVHVCVDETRPRNQGLLTAWELEHQGVAHTYIVDNAGGDGSVVVGKLLEGKDQNRGFNAQTGKYEDLVKSGIIDPTKVVRIALQDAASVAGILITTEAMVAEKPEPKGAPAMPAGGMPDMGGMM